MKVSVQTYLSTAYHPDCEYVDGEVLERNFGDHSHSRLQALLCVFVGALERQLGIEVLIEVRMRINATRYRVPDVCACRPEKPYEPILTKPPLICVEILSPEDRMAQVLDSLADYIAFGVPHVSLLDPASRKAFVCTRDGLRQVYGSVLKIEEPAVELPVADLFSRLG